MASIQKQLEKGRQTPMNPLAAIFATPTPTATLAKVTGNSFFTDAGSLINVLPASPSTTPQSTAFSQHPDAPLKDNTVGQEGMALKKGVYLCIVSITAGEAGGGGGANGSVRWAITKSSPGAGDSLLVSSNIVLLATAGSGVTSAGPNLYSETKCGIINIDVDRTVQFRAVVNSASATADSTIRAGQIMFIKLGQYPDAD